MKNYITYNIQSKEIISFGVCQDIDFEFQYGLGEGVIEGQASNETAYVSNGQLVMYTPEQAQTKQEKPAFFFVWSNETFSWIDPRDNQQIYEGAVSAVNLIRNQRLSESDWVVVKAVDTDTPIPENWKVYRQALRDITKQSGYPLNVDWPIQPE